MVFLFYRHSVADARVCRTRSTWPVFMKACIGRQEQLQHNTGHASPLVAAELITNGALTAWLIRDSRLWFVTVLSRHFRARETACSFFEESAKLTLSDLLCISNWIDRLSFSTCWDYLICFESVAM